MEFEKLKKIIAEVLNVDERKSQWKPLLLMILEQIR